MNYKIVLESVLMLAIMVSPTQGKNFTEDTCRNETYSPRTSITFKCSDPAYCSTLLTGRTKPDDTFNTNCKRFCPGCFQAIKDLLASKKPQTQTPIPDPTTPPVTEPTTTEVIPDIKNATTPSAPPTDLEITTGPSQENSSPWNHVWTAIIIIVIAFVFVVGVCLRKQIRTGCARLCMDQHYISVQTAVKKPDLGVPTSPEIPEHTAVLPQDTSGEAASDEATHIIQNGTTSNGCAKSKSTSVVIDERRTEVACGVQQRAASDVATHISQNGVIPNGTASRMEPALHSVQNATASGTDATPQMGAMPQSSTQQAAPNETGPQVGNIPQALPNRVGATPQPAPNGVPTTMAANPQVVTNSNPTGSNTTQQSAGAGGSVKSTSIGTVNHYHINLPPLHTEPAPTTKVRPKENLRYPVQEKGKGAEPETTKEVRDDDGGPHKFSSP